MSWLLISSRTSAQQQEYQVEAKGFLLCPESHRIAASSASPLVEFAATLCARHSLAALRRTECLAVYNACTGPDYYMVLLIISDVYATTSDLAHVRPSDYLQIRFSRACYLRSCSRQETKMCMWIPLCKVAFTKRCAIVDVA